MPVPESPFKDFIAKGLIDFKEDRFKEDRRREHVKFCGERTEKKMRRKRTSFPELHS